MGNLRSVQKGLERVGFRAEVTRDAERIEAAAGVVLPGVGAFGACMDNLRTYGLVDTVRRVIERGTPFLGICLGMQLLFDESEEFGPRPRPRHLSRPRRALRRPAGRSRCRTWAGTRSASGRTPPHLRGIDDGTFVYFVHSYYVVPADPSLTATSTDYGVEFTSAIARDNVFATQYHPEKSQAVGLEDSGELRADRGEPLMADGYAMVDAPRSPSTMHRP